jgi:hypothetical protein
MFLYAEAAMPHLRSQVPLALAELRTMADGRLRRELTLDDIGDVTSRLRIGHDELEGLFDALEGSAIGILAPEGGDGEALLARVLKAARSLKTRDLEAKPSRSAIASESGLTDVEVAHALALMKVFRAAL